MRNPAVRDFFARWYLPFVFVVWTFAPEVRRLVDWQTGFHKISPFTLLPLVLMIPGFLLLPSRWSTLGRGYRWTATLWFIGFGFAFLVAFASGGTFGGLYDLTEFLLPVGVGGLIYSVRENFDKTYDRIASTLLWSAALSSAYAIFQYVALPPWDAYWLTASALQSQGDAEAFGFRVFGTFNSTGPFALLILTAVVFNLPRLRLSKIVPILLLAPCLIALTLTSVRLSWIGLVLSCAVYILLSPSRRGAILAFATVAASFVLVGGILVSVIPNATIALTTTTDRLMTFQDLQGDSSVNARQNESGDAWTQGVSEPLGQGLGSSDNGSKLSGGEGGGLDNGYLNAFIEMGVFGWLAYLVAMFVALASTVSAYGYAKRRNSSAALTLAACALSFQILLLILEAGFSNHGSYVGIFFWMSLFLGEASRKMVDEARTVPKVVEEPQPLRPGFAT